MDIDAFDAKILALLQRNNRLTHEAVGEVVGLSPTVISRRIKRLRESGAIEAEVAIVNAKLAGPRLLALVLCKLERAEADTWDQFAAYLRSSAEVISAYAVAGEVDVAFSVAARTIEEYHAFLGRVIDAFPTLRNVTTHVALERIKGTRGAPIDPIIGP